MRTLARVDHDQITSDANYTLMNSCLVHEPQQVACNLFDASKRLFENGDYNFSHCDPRLIERYLQERIFIQLHFRVRDVEGEFVACFKRETVLQGEGYSRQRFNASNQKITDLVHKSRIDEADTGPSGHQQAMLVDAVEVMESPKGVISSLVWLDSLDGIYSVLPHALYFSLKSGLLTVGERFTLADWEADLIRRFDFVNRDKSARQVVQSASHVLNRVSGSESNLRRDGRHFDECVDFVSNVRINLYSEFVGIGLEKLKDGSPEIVDVVIGPLDL